MEALALDRTLEASWASWLRGFVGKHDNGVVDAEERILAQRRSWERDRRVCRIAGDVGCLIAPRCIVFELNKF